MNYYLNFVIRLLLSLVPVSVFSFILTPLTIYTSFLILSAYNPILSGNFLIINNIKFEFVEACIVTYAYYFFWVLVLLTKEIRLKIRFEMLFFGFILIFLMNVFRIGLVIYLGISHGFFWFNLVHLIFWKFIMGVYVALIWIFLIKVYSIKSVPIWDDLKFLYKDCFKKK